MAFVLIQHLDPKHKSMMVELLAAHTAMQVVQVADGMLVERDHVHLNPPGTCLAIAAGTLRLSKPLDMPRGAIVGGGADLVLTGAKIPQALVRYGRQNYVKDGSKGLGPRTPSRPRLRTH